MSGDRSQPFRSFSNHDGVVSIGAGVYCPIDAVFYGHEPLYAHNPEISILTKP